MNIFDVSQGKTRINNLASVATAEATRSFSMGRDFIRQVVGGAILSDVLKNRQYYNDHPVIVGAQYSAILDRKTCKLCRYLDGMIVNINDPMYEAYQPPLHHACRCLWNFILSTDPDVENLRFTFMEPEVGLISKHGSLLSARLGIPYTGRTVAEARAELLAFAQADERYKLPSDFALLAGIAVLVEWDRVKRTYRSFTNKLTNSRS